MSIDKLLNFIAEPESRQNYNAIWGGIGKADYPSQPLTQMTIGEVLDWQDSIDMKYMSEASGAWQFMEDTLRGLYREVGLRRDDQFSESNQRKLAIGLLRRRGLDDFISGQMTDVTFAQNLSKEWASLPCTVKDKNGSPATGQSYYSGDGLNKAHVSIPELMTAVASVKDQPERPLPERRTSLKQSTTVRAALATGAGGAGMVATALGQLDPMAQYIVLCFAGVMVVGLGWILRRRIRRWADGDR